MIWPTLNSGKYGTFICNIVAPEISKTKQHLTFKISMMVHDLVRNKGAGNVTVADIMQIYRNEFHEWILYLVLVYLRCLLRISYFEVTKIWCSLFFLLELLIFYKWNE